MRLVVKRVLRQTILPQRRFSSVQVNHTPEASNTTSVVFNFTPENEQQITEILKRYPSNYKKSAVIPLLFLAQNQNDNYVPLSAMNKIADILEIPPIDVYEVASFYTMFNRTPVGRFHLQVCGTTPCLVRGADKIFAALEEHLGIHIGETTADGLFTLSEVECLGACVNAPMLQVNNQWVYEDLTEQNVVELVEKFKAGEPVKRGPQNHRRNSEGPLGRVVLKDVENLTTQDVRHDRDFTKAKEDWQKAKDEAAAKKAQEEAAAKKAKEEEAAKKAKEEEAAKNPQTPNSDKKDTKTDSPAQKDSKADSSTQKDAKIDPVVKGEQPIPAHVTTQNQSKSQNQTSTKSPGPNENQRTATPSGQDLSKTRGNKNE